MSNTKAMGQSNTKSKTNTKTKYNNKYKYKYTHKYKHKYKIHIHILIQQPNTYKIYNGVNQQIPTMTYTIQHTTTTTTYNAHLWCESWPKNHYAKSQHTKYTGN